MSFDVFLVHFRDGVSKSSPHAPIQRVLDAAQVRDASAGTCSVLFPSGSHVEVSCTPDESDPTMCGSAAFFMRGYDAAVLQFMLDVARAGDMVMFPAMEGSLCILVDENQRRHVPSDLDYELVLARTPEELAALFQGGFQAWQAYRDQVMELNDDEED